MWTKLDDGFTEHPKVVEAGPLGLALHVSAMVYAGRNLTDGYIPDSVAERLLDLRHIHLITAENELMAAGASADEFDWPGRLVALGLWHDFATVQRCRSCLLVWPSKQQTGYLIHDFLDFNPTRDKVLADRAAAKDRRENAKRASAERRANVNRETGEVLANVIDPDPLPTRPAPVPDLDPEPDPQEQELEQHLRVENHDAPSSNGKKSPLAIDDHQQGLLVRLWAERPEWAEGKGALTYPGFVSLMKKHGAGPLNDALEELLFDPWAADLPHPWLDKVAGENAKAAS